MSLASQQRDEEKKEDADAPYEEDCPICLDPMHPQSDSAHPLQCASSHCTFNMCACCVESLITSSNDGYEEASDGNMHVKVFLHCPNCRSDLGPTIRETLLLRKADFLLSAGGRDAKDEDLTPSQLRLRGVIDDEDVKKAIADARKRERDFFCAKLEAEGGPGCDHGADDSESPDDSDSDSSVDEWGVEADINSGVHKSFRVPKHKNVAEMLIGLEGDDVGEDLAVVDDTLMGGFEKVLSDDKKKKVAGLLVSGDASSLAEAAQIMHKTIHKPKVTKSKSFVQRRNLRSSVFVLIDDAAKARPSLEKATGPAGDTMAAAAAARGHLARNNAHNIAREQAAIRKRAEHLRSHPLPVRMPKYVELIVPVAGAGDPPLSFVDDEWDGTVADAYTKITVGGVGLLGIGKERAPRVSKRAPPVTNKGVINVLSEGINPDDTDHIRDRIDVPGGRVLVASVRNEAGRRGVVKGDVVTHLNGEAFSGTARELAEEMGRSGPRVNLVLNAERSVAEALRRRDAAANRARKEKCGL